MSRWRRGVSMAFLCAAALLSHHCGELGLDLILVQEPVDDEPESPDDSEDGGDTGDTGDTGAGADADNGGAVAEGTG